MNILRNMVIATLGLILASSANATIIWNFDLPGTATASQTPPYDSLGTLTLQDITGGVKFTLDPDQNNTGYNLTNSHIISLDFVYAGSIVPTYVNETGGPTITDFDYITANDNIDAGYKVTHDYISMKWDTSSGDDFLVNQVSMWEILGVTEADFTNTFATSGPKPSPITAILSVSAYTTDIKPTPSNWVAGVADEPDEPGVSVPEPGILGLLGIGLLGLQLSRRKPSA